MSIDQRREGNYGKIVIGGDAAGCIGRFDIDDVGGVDVVELLSGNLTGETTWANH